MKNQRVLERYIDLCRRHKVASVDIFGTLIQRVVANDSDLYSLIGRSLEREGFNFSQYHGFAALRESAQRVAASQEENGEVTLDAIYAQLEKMTQFSAEAVKHFKSKEVEYHYKVTYADTEMLQTVRRLKELHIPVIIISDMYLPSSVLQKMLSSVGYGEFDSIFVSCEMRANKHNGTIFSKVLERLKINPSDVVHIGDSRRGDFLEPQLHGMKALLYHSSSAPNATAWFSRFAQLCLSKQLSGSATAALARHFGYIYAGPVFVSMMQWLEREIGERKIAKMYFLSREGKFLQQCWDEWHSQSLPATHYLHVSRKSTLLPHLYSQLQETQNEDFATLVELSLTNKLLTVSQLLKELGLTSPQRKKIYDKYSLRANQIISRPFPLNIRSVIDEVVPIQVQSQYQLLVDYLHQEGMTSGSVALIDIGWKGTMQIALQKVLTSAGESPHLVGFYAGLSKESPLTIQQAVGCFFSGERAEKNEILLTGFRELFETLCMPNEGTTLLYAKARGSVIPILDQSETQAEARVTIDEYQQGILEFIRSFRNSPYRDEVIPSDEAFKVLAHEFYNPSAQLLHLFAAIQTYDHGEITPVAQHYPLRMYLHPRVLLKTFFDSPWRVGWIALNTPTRNPGRVYLRLRSILNRR